MLKLFQIHLCIINNCCYKIVVEQNFKKKKKDLLISRTLLFGPAYDFSHKFKKCGNLS